MLSLILPLYRPASLLHTGYELFAAGRLRYDLKQSDRTIGYEAFLGVIYEQVILILTPCHDLALFDQGSVKMTAFFGYRQSALPAKVIGELLLSL